ncbi:hypothetical protein NCCP1664_17790 [Zafaria cholistanensis]|uniref:Tyr recombinase domain-containing protein n=1 Tax=Zafaria cholistanensis TaxID=1682741 RepID=A0A5A7NQZ9_9MICC|nr:hypothetical protein [Zafaria cholistanensis]GER23283.1 hypothetical protein NCCP1664_17790 [Zafaria cholistanensis]
MHEDSYSWFAGAIERAGLPRITPNDLRHRAASFAVSTGANVKAMQRILSCGSDHWPRRIGSWFSLFERAVWTFSGEAREAMDCPEVNPFRSLRAVLLA